MSDPHPPSHRANPDPDPRRWWALAVLCAAQFIVILDTSVVGVALPALQRALGFDPSGLQWIFDAYVIALGGLMLLGGRLSDMFGARRVFALGFGVLTVASLAAGLATSSSVLLASRALQGAGAALIAPSSLSLVMALFGARPAELGRALGFWGAAAAAGGTAGVFLGGVVTEGLSWRWTFLVNVPLGLAVLAATASLLPRGARTKGALDLLGAGLATVGVALLGYGIVALGGSPLAVEALVAAAVLLVGFVLLERRRASPLVPLAIFRAPDLALGNVVTALLGGAWIPMWFFLNMVLQDGLGLGAFESGLALLPMTVAIMIAMVGLTGRLVARIGAKRSLVLGLGSLAVALALFAVRPPDGGFVATVLGPSLLAALGMAAAYVPSVMVATAGARPEDGGLASGLVNTRCSSPRSARARRADGALADRGGVAENRRVVEATILFRPGDWTDAAELEAARASFAVATVRRGITEPGLVIARYAGVPFYEELAADLADLGVRLANSVEEHRFAADPRRWTPVLDDLTPRTWSPDEALPDHVAFMVAPVAPTLGDDGAVPALAADRGAARALVEALADEPLADSRGVVIREHVPRRVLGEDLFGRPIASEWRCFAWAGAIVATGLVAEDGRVDLAPGAPAAADRTRLVEASPSPPPEALALARTALARIAGRATFVALDVAERASGGWFVAALRDGSDALLGRTDPAALYGGLAGLLAHERPGTRGA